MTQEEKKKKNSRNIIIIVVAIVLLVVSPFVLCIGAGFFGAMSESMYEESTPYEPEETVEEEEVVINSTIGESVDLDGVVWTINKAEDRGNRLPYLDADEFIYTDTAYLDCVTDEGKFIYLEITVENNSSSPISIPGQGLYNSEGQEFWRYTSTYGCIENSISYYESLNPNMSLTFEEVYDISKDDSGFKYIVKDQSYSDKDVVFELGF